MFRSTIRLSALIALFVPVAAQAFDIQQHFVSAPLTPTNSNRIISVPQFDSAVGSLEAVELSLWGHVEGSARFESLNASNRTVTMNLAARIDLTNFDGTLISSVLPITSVTDTVSGFDGVMDFGGTSGRTYSNLMADTTAPLRSFTDAATLNLFTGSGLMNFPVTGTGASTASGPGNIVYQFSTATSAWVQVTYHYAVVPEPFTAGLLCLSGLLLRRRGQ